MEGSTLATTTAASSFAATFAFAFAACAAVAAVAARTADVHDVGSLVRGDLREISLESAALRTTTRRQSHHTHECNRDEGRSYRGGGWHS